MKKIKMFTAISFLAIALVAMPSASFAKEGRHNEDEDNKGVKIEQRANLKVDQEDSRSNSFFGRLFSRWFGSSSANAQTIIKSNSMPNISGITAPTVLKTGQVGTWIVKASDPQNGSLSYAVDWGDQSTNTAERMMPIFVQTSTFTHAYAKAGNYTVKFTVTNEAGMNNSSSATVHVTGDTVLAAPVISNFSAVSNKPRQATLKWNTDVRGSSVVWYSKTSPVNTSGTPNVSRPAKILDHKITLTRLEPNTKYYVIVGSANGGGMTTSAEASFTTKAIIDADAPVIINLTGSTKIAVGATETVTVNAYDPNNDSLSYSVDWGDSASIMALSSREEAFVQSATFSHVYGSEGTYTATFTVTNSAGKKVSSSMDIAVKG